MVAGMRVRVNSVHVQVTLVACPRPRWYANNQAALPRSADNTDTDTYKTSKIAVLSAQPKL